MPTEDGDFGQVTFTPGELTQLKAQQSALDPAAGSGAFPLVDFQFPIRDGISTRMFLPRDLTEAEADRLTRAIRLCVIPNTKPREPRAE